MIRVYGLRKQFGRKQVLNGANLEVGRGETHVILGRSGEGKSVLLKLICMLMRPDRGHVEMNGRRLNPRRLRDLRRVRQTIQMVFQNAALFDSMTVAENVAFHAIEHGRTPRRRAVAFARPYLELVNMADSAHLMPAELSGGMRKRVALARALAAEPGIMLYDEPTTGLDPLTGDVINQLIRKTQQRTGLTSMVVTHDLHSARTVGDRFSFLHEGRIIQTDSLAGLMHSEHDIVRRFVAQQTAVA